MSYILDALKKSENERRAGVTPGLAPASSYVVLPQHRSQHRGAALLVAVGMLGTGLALGNWRPWQEDMAGGQMRPPAPVAGAVAAPLPVATVADTPLPSKPRAGAAAKAAAVVTAKTSTVVAKKRSVQSPPERRGVATIAQPAATRSAAADTAVASKPPLVSAPIAAAKPTVTAPPAAAGSPMTAPTTAAVPAAVRLALAAPVAVAVPAAAPDATPVTVAAPAAAVPVVPAPVAAVATAAPRVVAYRELPAAVQSALPNIVFGGFAGGGEADGRIAFINNRLVREGEEVSPGLRLETVDQNGAVLGFQGHHFRTAQ